MFEYLYYWFCFHHFRRFYKDNDNLPIFPAAVAVGAVQFLLLFDIIMALRLFFSASVSFNKTITIVLAFAVVTAFTWFNYKLYGSRIKDLIKKYELNDFNKKLKGWMIFLLMFILFLFPILLSFFVHLFV